MKEAPPTQFNLKDFALVSLMPLVFGKLLILFCGSMYSAYRTRSKPSAFRPEI